MDKLDLIMLALEMEDYDTVRGLSSLYSKEEVEELTTRVIAKNSPMLIYYFAIYMNIVPIDRLRQALANLEGKNQYYTPHFERALTNYHPMLPEDIKANDVEKMTDFGKLELAKRLIRWGRIDLLSRFLEILKAPVEQEKTFVKQP